VVVDFEWEAELQEVLLPAFTVAAGHPYADLGDFRGIRHKANFPIRPLRSTPAVDCARDALATGATAIVLPELHVDARALRRIAALVADHDAPCLMIAGSRHDKTGGRKLNITTGLFAGVDEPLVHTKLSRVRLTPPAARCSSSSTSRTLCACASGRPARCASPC
jgi:hypothetical protein